MAEKHNIFVSHYTRDEAHIEALRNLLGDQYEFKNSSVTTDKYNEAHDEDYIKTILRSRISWAKTVVCLIGPHTHEREWVNYEIEAAARQGKQIIGIFLHGSSDADIPEAVEKYASAIVGWNTERIIDALLGESHFEQSDGTPRPRFQSARGLCCS